MSQADLLEALARFLHDLPPAVSDPGLAFRVRVAAWLAGGLAREARLAPVHAQAQAERLATLLGEPAPTEAERGAWLAAAEARLAAALRHDALNATALEAARAHLVASLGEALDIVQPGFDRRLDIEGKTT